MRIWIIVISAGLLFLGGVLFTNSAWDGDITDAAASAQAEEAGRAGFDLLPWTIEGDLLLFLFLAGGFSAGFASGYFWRKLFSEKIGDGAPTTEGGRVDREIT